MATTTPPTKADPKILASLSIQSQVTAQSVKQAGEELGALINLQTAGVASAIEAKLVEHPEWLNFRKQAERHGYTLSFALFVVEPDIIQRVNGSLS